MSRLLRRLREDEGGWSLTELLTTMMILSILLGAIILTYTTFTQENAISENSVDAEQSARQNLTIMSNALRTAGPTTLSSNPVLYVGNYDIQVNTTDWPGSSGTSTGPNILRYCVDTNRNLWQDGIQNTTSATPDTSGNCPSTNSGWTHTQLTFKRNDDGGPAGVVMNRVNNQPLFTADSSTTSAIRAITINLQLDKSYRGTEQANGTLSLSSAVTIRSRANTTPITPTTTTSCNADATGVLSLNVTSDANGDPLSAVFTEGGVKIGNGTSVGFATGSHTITTTVTDVLGMSSSSTVTVVCP